MSPEFQIEGKIRISDEVGGLPGCRGWRRDWL